MATIEVLDSTLRDGAQAPGISYSLQDKLKIIGLLDRLGVDLIEAGNPASNPKDAELYRRADRLRLKRARLAAFGMTCRAGISPQEDPAMAALLAADTGVVVLVGKASADQVRRVLKTDLALSLIHISPQFPSTLLAPLRITPAAWPNPAIWTRTSASSPTSWTPWATRLRRWARALPLAPQPLRRFP